MNRNSFVKKTALNGRLLNNPKKKSNRENRMKKKVNTFIRLQINYIVALRLLDVATRN